MSSFPRRSEVDRLAAARAHLRDAFLDVILLDLTRIEAGRLAISATECEVGPVLAEVRELFTPAATEGKHQFLVSTIGMIPPVLADRNRLIQVFSNLVANAIKFAPPTCWRTSSTASGRRGTPSTTGPDSA